MRQYELDEIKISPYLGKNEAFQYMLIQKTKKLLKEINMYPLTVRVEKKRVVVVGGGKVAGFKIIPLLKQGADIVVVSPELDANLVKLVEEKKIRWYQREYEKSDINGAF